MKKSYVGENKYLEQKVLAKEWKNVLMPLKL